MRRMVAPFFIGSLVLAGCNSATTNDTGPSALTPSVLEGYVPPSSVSGDVWAMVGKSKSMGKQAAVKIQKQRGVIETGLVPAFVHGADCPMIDGETWAIDYSHKRLGAALHKGIDIPQPVGVPIRAVADGTVVGKFLNKGNRKGIEIVLRHVPSQTGLGFYTYSQYTHLDLMPDLPIGARVAMGDPIGVTGNSGKQGKRVRRPALHFAILYSDVAQWSNDGRRVAPVDGYFMDPNAFYRLQGPYDSASMRALPRDEKRVPVPYLQTVGTPEPAQTRRIWPYPCGRT